VSLDRALELAGAQAGRAYPNPTIGAVLVRGGVVVGEGVTEEVGGRHAEIVALDVAGAAADGATLFVTMEPCGHHGRTPPCVDAVIAARVARVVVASRDPSPQAGGGLERLLDAGIEAVLDERAEARRQNEAWRTWSALARPHVILKLAVTLDGRVTVPGSRWITGEAALLEVHELRAAVDAVAVGMGTVLADAPRLDARNVPVVRQPRRLAFGKGPLPPASTLELRSGSIADELEALAREGVQSLLLEGGPTLATAFLRAGVVDRLRLYVAPTIAGAGLHLLGELPEPISTRALSTRAVGDDVVIDAILREV
jgi:diaminohydroxyphosphoribosylaminopyrimidine deaminase/5-amino-6-(5-phosphoribosylamino)uracil reductase